MKKWMLLAVLGLNYVIPAFVTPAKGRQVIEARPARVASAMIVARPSLAVTFPFDIDPRPGDRRTIELYLDRPGQLEITATWPSTINLAVILNGPGQTGYYARRNGGSPQTISFTVNRELIEAGGSWSVSLVNFSGAGPATRGSLSISLPAGESETPSGNVNPADYVGLFRAFRDRKILTDGAIQMMDPDGRTIRLIPGINDIHVIRPDTTDTTTIVLYSTQVPVADPPAKPGNLSSPIDFQNWLDELYAWLESINFRMLLSISAAFDEGEIDNVLNIEADNHLESSFQIADFRLKYMQTIIEAFRASEQGSTPE